MNTFSVCNQKGGVGKTTTSVNLAACLAEQGFRILLIDMDPQGNATSGLGIQKNSVTKSIYEFLILDASESDTIINDFDTKISIIPSNKELTGALVEIVGMEHREFLLQKKIQNLKNRFDFIIIDCPPSLGLLTLNALVASDSVLIPLQCEYYALEGLAELVNTCDLVKQRLNPSLDIGGVLMTMADFRTNLTQQVIDEVRTHFKDKVFNTVIARSVKVSEAPSFGKPIIHYEPESKGAHLYREFAKEFAARFKPARLIEPIVQQQVIETISKEL